MLIKILSAVKGIADLHLNRYNVIHNLMENDGKQNTYPAINKSQE
jgi:methylmalonyl-CoA mutase cobalamin-binding subunit